MTRHLALRVLAGVAWFALLLRALHVFGPGSPNVDFNSDSAIPVLMSLDKGPITPFNLYYFAQDRWGAWPFLFTQLVRNVTGLQWTPESVFLLHAVWVFSGSLVLAALSKRDALLIALGYLFALCLHTEARFMLFRLSQPYAWQATGVLLAWLGLRRLFDGYLAAPRVGLFRRAGWLALAFVATFLSVASSTLSAPFIAALLALEALRAWWKRPPGQTRMSVLAPGLLGFAAVAGGCLAEHLQKAVFHRYGQRTYGRDFATNLALDWSFLAVNAGKAWDNVLKLSWWPLYFAPAAVLAVFLGALAYAHVRGRRELKGRLIAALADDTAVVAIGAYLVSIVNVAVVVVVAHVRYNDYDDRYLTPTHLLAPISAFLCVLLLVRFLSRTPRVLRAAELGFIGVLALSLLVAFPARGSDKRYREQKETAVALARKAPYDILMGTYWDTYFLVALMPVRPLTPLPFEGHTNRMPWTVERLQEVGSAVVAFRRDSDRGQAPPMTLRQYGVSLVLSDPKFYEESEYVFARYRTVVAEESSQRRTYGPSELALSRCARLGPDNVIEAENCRGFVVFGPYISVPRGAKVEFSFELETAQPLRVTSDLTSAAGKTTHGSIPEHSVRPGAPHWSGQIVHFFEPAEKLESRIIVHADGPNSFKIRKLALSVH